MRWQHCCLCKLQIKNIGLNSLLLLLLLFLFVIFLQETCGNTYGSCTWCSLLDYCGNSSLSCLSCDKILSSLICSRFSECEWNSGCVWVKEDKTSKVALFIWKSFIIDFSEQYYNNCCDCSCSRCCCHCFSSHFGTPQTKEI